VRIFVGALKWKPRSSRRARAAGIATLIAAASGPSTSIAGRGGGFVGGVGAAWGVVATCGVVTDAQPRSVVSASAARLDLRRLNLDARGVLADRRRFVNCISRIVALAAVACNLACATSTKSGDVAVESAAKMPPAATKLAAPPAAVHSPDAPGLNVEDLSARLRIAVARTSGVPVVDELSVKRELAACTEAPCPDALASQYRDAGFVVGSSVSKVGSVFLTTVRIERGAVEMVRTTAQAGDARVSIETAGLEAGAELRKKLIGEGVAEGVWLPSTQGTPDAGDERGAEP
jgi:hypothetical protein